MTEVLRRWHGFATHRWPAQGSFFVALLRVALLLVPLGVVEHQLWHSPKLLWPAMQTYESAIDMKRMLFDDGDACPDLVAIGTSLTDRTIIGRHMDGKRLERRFRVKYSFDLASGQMRPETMLAQWRWLQRRGCTPRYVVVELTPLVLNEAGESQVHDPATIDLRTLLGMPDAFLETRGYDVAEIAQLLTYEQLFSFRRRKEVMRRIGQELDLAKAGPRDFYPHDGQLRGVPNRTMGPVNLAKETRRRRNRTRRGRYEHRMGDLQVIAMDLVVDEIAASKARLIFHTPPVLPLYRQEFEKLGGKPDWCAVVARYRKRPGIEWFNQFSTTEYTKRSFADWVHLNKKGARLYARNFRLAVFHKKYPHDGYCD